MVSDNAIKLFEALPLSGKISGGNLKDKTGLNTTELKEAKAELKAEGLVVLGKGRGGTVARAEGAELPEQPKKLSKDESLELAREAKKEKTQRQKADDAIREHVRSVGEKRFPKADEVNVGFYDKSWYVEVWKDGVARVHWIEDEALL